MLNEAQLEALQSKHGKIGIVDYAGHQIVFRRPTRENVREYRRKMESAAEKPDAMDQLAQVTLVAFDGEDDANKARATFTTVFLEDYPLAISNPRFNTVLSVLSGLTAEEDAADLGKGVSVKSGRRPTSPTA